jgi:predicted RNA-binding Zn-ribbon protein involved in translation (DUF1610 family)
LFEQVVQVFRESGRVVPVFIDKHGKRIRISLGEIARRRSSVQGHESRQYCHDCRKTRSIVTFKSDTAEHCCPKCGGTRLTFSIRKDEEVVCPKCQRGCLKESGRWIT